MLLLLLLLLLLLFLRKKKSSSETESESSGIGVAAPPDGPLWGVPPTEDANLDESFEEDEEDPVLTYPGP